MNRRKAVEWMMGELPDLVERGLITADAAEGLKRHYGGIGDARRRNWGRVAFAVFGGTLVGLGIILVFAHNWENMSRQVRTVVSLLPLLCAQALCGWVLLRRANSPAWREGTSSFLVLALGAAISLVAQTYHMGSDWGAFILSWMLPSLPIVYLMDVTAPALMYLAGVTSWGAVQRWEGGTPFWFWALAALLVPHYFRAIRRDRFGSRAILLGWMTAICGGVAIGFSINALPHRSWAMIYLSYFASLYLFGLGREPEKINVARRPFLLAGLLGICAVAYTLTFRWNWTAITHGVTWRSPLDGVEAVGGYLTVAVLAAGVAVGLARSVVRRYLYGILFGAVPLLAMLGYILVSGYGLPPLVPVIIFNLLFLSLGVVTAVKGIGDAESATANGGMILIAAIVMARFFDSGFGILARGVVFILLGIGFLAANMVIWRRKAAQ